MKIHRIINKIKNDSELTGKFINYLRTVCGFEKTTELKKLNSLDKMAILACFCYDNNIKV